MFEGAVAGLLNRLLGKYVQDLDTENLNVGIFSGSVNLTDLKLKHEALYELDLPIDVKIGTIGRVNIQIPWALLYSQPIVVNIEDVLVLVGPAISDCHFDPEREKRLMRAAKMKILQDLESRKESLVGPQNLFEQLFMSIVNNLQVYIRNVHFRYEDSISSPDGPMACGLCLQGLSIETTNSKWKPDVCSRSGPVYQLIRVESLSLYWNSRATVLPDTETAYLTPMQYYSWKHYMATGLEKLSMHHEEFDLLLKPLTCKVKVIVNRSGEARVPKLLVDAVIQDSAIQLSRRQYLSIHNLTNEFQRISLNRKYRHLHPGVPVIEDLRKWWLYAFQAVLEQRVRPYTWGAIKRHRENYERYRQTYKRLLHSPNDTEIKMELTQCEDRLPILAILVAREHANIQLLAEESDRIQVEEVECEWWKTHPGEEDGGEHGDAEITRTKKVLLVNTGRSKSLWSHLSSPERQRICELMGRVQGTPRQDKPRQYIEHKVNLTLANCSLTLMNKSKEVLVANLTQLLLSLETRPSAKAYKLSARAESIIIHAADADSSLAPLLLLPAPAPAPAPPAPGPSLALDVERSARPHTTLTVQHAMLYYSEYAVTELLNLFTINRCPLTTLREVVTSSPAAIVRSALRRRTAHVNLELKGFTLLLPERERQSKSARLLVLDVTKIILKSDLQPSNLTLEDATCMELEERLYDRLHAECTCQILFCDSKVEWQEARKQPDSALHLVSRTRMQAVFSNSIKKDYKLLPRYKLNLSISSIKLNLSDRAIGLLLDFYDNLPVPTPDTVFLESSDEEDLKLGKDRVYADPGYGELVRLRQRIVNAYFSRIRTAESAFDVASATQGFRDGTNAFVSSEHSDSDMEVYARTVDLPGFEDNVSPSNTIRILCRLNIGELAVNLARSSDAAERPYVSVQITKACVELAILEYGPALQISVQGASLTDRQHQLQLFTSDKTEELCNLLYRKVRASCPEFKSHFHSVEQSLVLDIGASTVLLHSDAARTLYKYLQYIGEKIQDRHSINVSAITTEAHNLWDRLARSDLDPPVPPGATKFSYSMRLSSLEVTLCHSECSVLAVRIGALDSEAVFRANERLLFKLYLATLRVSETTLSLYPSLVWPDEDRVLELKYVRTAPKFYGEEARDDVKANGELRFYLGRLHVVLFYSVLMRLQQFLEPLIPNTMAYDAWQRLEKEITRRVDVISTTATRLNLVIEIHAPILLLPQNPSSPNVIVVNTGDLFIENFFKRVSVDPPVSSPNQTPVVDNILIKWVNVTLCRAVMSLSGTLETQEPILEPVSARCDLKRFVSCKQLNSLLWEGDVLVECVNVNLAQRDLAALWSVWDDNLMRQGSLLVPSSPTEVAPSDTSVRKLQEFFAQGEPVRKDAAIRFTLEGLEFKLFTDTEEVVSSPVREPSQALAVARLGALSCSGERFSDGSAVARATLASLTVQDVRCQDAPQSIFTSQPGSQVPSGISIERPPLMDLHVRTARAGTAVDVRVDRSRVTLAPGFLLQLARLVADSYPGDKGMEGGVINHGYVGEHTVRCPSGSDTSGYCSTAASTIAEETPSLSISVQFRQPEVMFFTDLTKTEGHTLLLRTEVIIDYSSHSNTESLVVSLAGLQVMSKLQSKLKSLPPQMVLRPCDVEFSRSFKSIEDGVRYNLSVSDVDIHLAATTVHTITDIIDEITSELSPADMPPFRLSPRPGSPLWAPRALPRASAPAPAPAPAPAGAVRGAGAAAARAGRVRLLCYEREGSAPLVMCKMSFSASIEDWSRGSAQLSVCVSGYNASLHTWEPLLESTHFTATSQQAKAYPMTTKFDTNHTKENQDGGDTKKKTKKKSESETDVDSDDDTVYIKNPNPSRNKGFVKGSAIFESLDEEDSDGDNDSAVDKMANAISHLFIDDSSGDENEDASSAAEQSEVETEMVADTGATETAHAEKEGGRREKTVTLQEPIRNDSMDSGLDTISFYERYCTYIHVQCKEPLKFTITPETARVLSDLMTAFTDKQHAVNTCIMTGQGDGIQLVNDIGPGSTVHLITRSETDLTGNDRVIAVADYDMDTSRPSTPGCDTSAADVLDENEETKPEAVDINDEWDCFPPSPPASPLPPAGAPALYERITNQRLRIRATDLDDLTVLCPQRSVRKLHVLHPHRHSTRYYVVVERASRGASTTLVVRSPLQVRNETSYALDLYYKKTDLQKIGATLVGSLVNPFDDKMRVATIAPDDTFNVPLYIASHCRLFLLPANYDTYQTATQGIWWKELANDLGTPRDMVCPAKSDNDSGIFAVRILTVEGVQSPKATRAIPNYLIRVLPPLAIYNRLPYAIDVCIPSLNYRNRIEAGERTYTYTVNLMKTHRVNIELSYLGVPWTGGFNLSPDTTLKNIPMAECGAECGAGRGQQVGLRVSVQRNCCWELLVHARCWLANTTARAVQLQASDSDAIFSVHPSPLLYCGGASRMRVRAGEGAWARACALLPGVRACLRAGDRASLTMQVTLSELCPQLTKIVTILPHFLVYNATPRHVRYMEANEAADLWLELPPQQCAAFHPLTRSHLMHCKFREAERGGQAFPINRRHFTVVPQGKGSAITVEVTGGVDEPFVITFKPYTPGDAPVRIDNLCDDLFLKLHQIHSGQVALLSPYQSMLYTWDDPVGERTLMWNIYNNKGMGLVADFTRDGYGEEKVSFQSVKHSTLIATNSVTSKLSSTFKRLNPKSPEPCSSSSDDSDSSDLPEKQTRNKKEKIRMRKDKVIVYWISYMDENQRVFALTQDERIAYNYRMKINAERSNIEFYLSLAGASLSVCVDSNVGVKELAYVSVTDSSPQWEVNVAHKWKRLSTEINEWIEDKYETEQKKCQLKEYLDVDLEKMQMTKPFFSELRRIYNPGIWMHLRKSDSHTYLQLKFHRIQIDNQLNEAIFPVVLHPAPLPTELVKSNDVKPSFELVTLKQHRPRLNQDVYKFFKVLIQEHCLNLDRGFVSYVFDILNHWKIEEKPAVRLRADLAVVHMPLPVIANKSQIRTQNNVVFEYAHISPIKLVLSLSPRGYSAEPANSPRRTRFGSNKMENRPKIFNSDLLEYLFNTWGSSLNDVKDVIFRLPYLEFCNTPLTISQLTDLSSRHYWSQLVQQFYVYVLDVKIVKNPFSPYGDFTKELAHYYEPYLGYITSANVPELPKLSCDNMTTTQITIERGRKRIPSEDDRTEDVPASVLEASRTNPASQALTLSGLIARPAFDEDSMFYRNICRAAHLGRAGARSPQWGSCVQRRRLPRHCPAAEGIRPYSLHSALGCQLFLLLGRGHFADSETYLAHAHLPGGNTTILVSTQHVFLIRSSSHSSWHVEWTVKLDELIGVPRTEGHKLVLHVRQDELVNYYARDEKIIEVSEPEVLAWLQTRIECALILAMEDKRCPAQL